MNLVTTTNLALAPWQYGQIFYHDEPSGASIQGGTYSLIGDGVDLLTRQISGDCTLIAHLAGITSTATAPDGSTANTGWLGGVILRGTTNMVPGYPWGQVKAPRPSFPSLARWTAALIIRMKTWSMAAAATIGGVTSGKWFKLVRTNGTNFTSFVSADGSTWTQVGNTNLTDFGTSIYAGIYTYAGTVFQS